MLSPFRLFCAAAVTALLLPCVVQGGAETPPQFQKATVVSRELALGEMMPDVALRNQDGGEMRLRDFRGRALALTFFYSRCTAAAFCPLVGRNFDAAQGFLVQMGVADQCHLLSISLDPVRDMPEVLAAYAKGYQADPAVWTFATGDEAGLRQMGEAVGLEYQRVGERIDHNLRTVVVDAGGHIRRIFRGDAWTPQELAAELNSVARRYR